MEQNMVLIWGDRVNYFEKEYVLYKLKILRRLDFEIRSRCGGGVLTSADIPYIKETDKKLQEFNEIYEMLYRMKILPERKKGFDLFQLEQFRYHTDRINRLTHGDNSKWPGIIYFTKEDEIRDPVNWSFFDYYIAKFEDSPYFKYYKNTFEVTE